MYVHNNKRSQWERKKGIAEAHKIVYACTHLFVSIRPNVMWLKGNKRTLGSEKI